MPEVPVIAPIGGITFLHTGVQNKLYKIPNLCVGVPVCTRPHYRVVFGVTEDHTRFLKLTTTDIPLHLSFGFAFFGLATFFPEMGFH